MTTHPAWQGLDGSTLPVGTMYCVGRNYADHAKEMNAVVPAQPLVFLKPPSAYRANNSTIVLPAWSADVHHEVELVVIIGSNASIVGYAVGLDMTARDVQAAAKSKGEPWTTSKAWKGSAPVSAFIPASQLSDIDIDTLTIALDVNGKNRQRATIGQMERDVPALIDYIHTTFELREGDCIFTGSPAGVASVRSGDVLTATLSHDTTLTTLTTIIA